MKPIRTAPCPLPPLLAAVMLAAVLLAAVGCVSKSQYESAQAELAQCQEEKAQADAKVISWEQRFDREAQRWEVVGASVTEQLPRALNELHEERDRIVEMVPEQVRGDVTRYLDEYFATVMGGFDRLVADNSDVRMELTATRQVLESLGTDTRAISQSIDTTLRDERAKRQKEQDRRDAVAAKIADVVALVTEFDNTRIQCRQCPDRLRLNRKQSDTISAFHGQLTSQLSQIQSFASTGDYVLTEDLPAPEEGE
ncbi:MAG TPA: hypothetical protein VGG06_16120 [Thermoanaerobaculia bacterium]|jgi:hypothetical protein